MPPPPPPPAPGLPKVGLQPQVTKPQVNSDDRGALLASIRCGAALKKTETNDRSAPIVDVKKSSANGISCGPKSHETRGPPKNAMSNGGPVLIGGGLFPNGVPKLRPSGSHAKPTTGVTEAKVPPSLPGPRKAPALPIKDPPPKMLELNKMPRTGFPSSPKPSLKTNPAPPPPLPIGKKPSLRELGGGGGRSNVPEPPNPANKPAPPRPPIDLSPPSPIASQPIPTKPTLANKPSLGVSKEAPPRPPSSSKPLPPPKVPGLEVNGRSSSIKRTQSVREQRSFLYPESGVPDFPRDDFCSSPDSLFLPQNLTQTLPGPLNLLKTNGAVPTGMGASRGMGMSATVGRAGGQTMSASMSRLPIDRVGLSRPTVPAPPPPSQPPPPPPNNHHRRGDGNFPPPPPSMVQAGQPPPPPPHRSKPEAMSSHINNGSCGGAPAPPTRKTSMASRTSSLVADLEARFASQFRSAQQFPMPKTFSNVAKSYPSHNEKISTGNYPSQHRRTAPMPPSNGGGPQGFHHHGNPPPPPPHAPIQLQMGSKMYATDPTSKC